MVLNKTNKWLVEERDEANAKKLSAKMASDITGLANPVYVASKDPKRLRSGGDEHKMTKW